MTTQARTLRPSQAFARPLPGVLWFMQQLWATVHRLDTASKGMATSLGVTGPQRLALRVVGLFPGASAGELATTLHVHPSTLTGVLQRLTAQGLLERRTDPLDGRRARFHLTRAGLRVNAWKTGTIEAGVELALSRVAPDAVAAAEQVLAALVVALDETSEDARRVGRRRRREAPRQ